MRIASGVSGHLQLSRELLSFRLVATEVTDT
jgi:hypothetical protein